MRRHRKCLPYIAAVVILLGVSACGGGGGESDSGFSFPAKTLSWAPPSLYTDGSPLDCVTELDSFEIYVKEAGPFSEADSPSALVSATDPISGQVATTFNLANLGPFLAPGVSYQVSLRAVALTGAKSDFSSPASFSF